MDTCIVCQTHPVNPAISKNHCSRICWNLSLRIDLQFTPADAMKRIALAKHEQMKEHTNAR